MAVSQNKAVDVTRHPVDSHAMTKAGRPSVRPSPLMLMVLVLLAEAPMHPYEMQRLMQWRGKDQVVRVQRGSLYPAVERLVKAGLIEPLETARDGRRPERTVYQLTEEGRETAETWLVTMIRTVRNEYPDFPAALSFLPMLSADDARAQLTARLLSLGREIAAMQSVAADLREKYDLPRLFTIEDDYRLAMLRGRACLGVRDRRRPGQRRTLLGRADDPGLGRGSAARDGLVPRDPADARGRCRSTSRERSCPGRLRRGSRSALLSATFRSATQRAGGVLRTHHRPGAGQMPCAAPRQR